MSTSHFSSGMEDNPFSNIMNAMRKYVVSTTLASADAWRNSTLISDHVIEEVSKLKQEPGKNIVLYGSSVLAHTLIENDLVDEFSLHVYRSFWGVASVYFPRANASI